jgi:hypothetical protein
MANCSSAWGTSSRSTHPAKPASKVANTHDNMFYILYSFVTYVFTDSPSYVIQRRARIRVYIPNYRHTSLEAGAVQEDCLNWDITPCSPFKSTDVSEEQLCLVLASCGFLLGLFFDAEDRSVMFFLNVG